MQIKIIILISLSLLIQIQFLNFAYGKNSLPKKRQLASTPLKFLKTKLDHNQFPKSFINKLLATYDSSKRDQVVRLNVMGFLASPNYNSHLTPEGLERCRSFLKKYPLALQAAERKYQVKKEIITALLWVESRLGDNHGDFHVASVYLNLLQSDQPELIQILLDDLAKKETNMVPALINKTKMRAKAKARWALTELWSLYKMNKLVPNTIKNLKGSFSGAFGYSQFLPSSYLKWAVSFKAKKKADLYNPEDAIVSVANYLKKNGFKKNNQNSYKKALYHYNKSHDYGEIILKIADSL